MRTRQLHYLGLNYMAVGGVNIGSGVAVSKERDKPELKFIADGNVIAEINLEESAKIFYLNQNELPFYEFDLPGASEKLVVSLNFKSINGHRGQVSNEDPNELTIDFYEVWIMMGIK